MKKVNLTPKTELNVKNINGFIKRKMTPFRTSAKVDCSKEYLDIQKKEFKDLNVRIMVI
jgi:putative transposon-encoded protein